VAVVLAIWKNKEKTVEAVSPGVQLVLGWEIGAVYIDRKRSPKSTPFLHKKELSHVQASGQQTSRNS
jgi:hypothetical protein